jgi:putative transposase
MENSKNYFLSVVVQLHPTSEQEILFRKNIGCCRFIYNRYVALRKENHQRYNQGKPELPLPTEKELKGEYQWLAEVDANSLVQARVDAQNAFKNCFKHGFGYPKFHRKGKKESFRIIQMNNDGYVRVEDRKIKIGKYGFVKSKGDWSQLRGRIKNITVKLDAGKWYASIQQEVSADEYYTPVNHRHEAGGIDLGVVRPLTVTDGERFALLGRDTKQRLEKAETKRKRYQRQFARKQQGSKNREKAKLRVQRAYQKERFIRKDFVEKASACLTKNFKTLIFEDLKIANMTKGGKNKSGLNREMLRLGLGSVVQRCIDKAARRGGAVIFVDPRYTSQMCSSCGTIDRESRKSQSRFHCISCGFKLNADRNAAQNILARGLA